MRKQIRKMLMNDKNMTTTKVIILNKVKLAEIYS